MVFSIPYNVLYIYIYSTNLTMLMSHKIQVDSLDFVLNKCKYFLLFHLLKSD